MASVNRGDIPPERPARVVFVGAGHGSLHALNRLTEFTRRGCEITLVSPTPFTYSGMAAATLGGRYAAGSLHIDTGGLVRAAGGRVLEQRALRVDASARRLVLEDGDSIGWDLLVLDPGSEVDHGGLTASARGTFRVKPIEELLRFGRALRDRLREGTTRVSVVGGGPSACEVAGNTLELARRLGGRVEVSLLTDGDRLLETMPRGAARAAIRNLRERGVEVLTGQPVARVVEGATQDASGTHHPFDLLVDATGLRPVGLIARSGMADAGGALPVDAHLRARGDARIFGAGDSVVVQGGEDVRPAGVHAVRQGPVLLHNLLATLDGGSLARFAPQRRYLLILDLGNVGLAVRNGVHWLGRPPLRLKEWIDLRFLRRYGGAPHIIVPARNVGSHRGDPPAAC
jgi:NADH dehydrogenase FAD-containing subunit